MADNKTLTAACAYLARGLGVFPLNGKVPTTEHGVKDASYDLGQIEEWFPIARNIAIAIPPGVVVVDVDPRNGGMETFNEWVAAYGWNLSEVPQAATGGSGMHFWFKIPPGVRLKKNPGPGVDLLTHGRYVVAPPSSTTDVYRWLVALPADLDDLPDCPGWLLQMARIEEYGDSYVQRTYSTTGDALDEAAHRMTSWESLLARHGWMCTAAVYGNGSDGSRWRHPLSDNAFSATIKHDCLFVYSPNTPFPVTESGDPHGVTLFSALEILDYGGDRKRCLQALRDAGYLPELPPRADVADLLPAPPDPRCPHGILIGETCAECKGIVAEEDVARRLTIETFGDIELRRVRWLWDGRIPTASLTLLAGREGEGKSTIAIDLMAAVTRGTLPGEFFGKPRDAIIVATEDSLEHTIKPRLLAAGADIDRVWRINMVDSHDSLSLPFHLADLEAALESHDIALIVLDPLLSRLSVKLDSHKDSEVRQALEPLCALADRLGAAVLGLIHLNKSGSTDPLQAVMASRAFVAVARSILFAMVDPDHEARHLLGLVKSNLGRTDLPTLTYTFDAKTVGDDDGPIVASKIAWGEETSTSVSAALQVTGDDKGALDEACDWLTDWLDKEGGCGFAAQAQRDGKAAGHSERTLRRALERIKAEKTAIGFPRSVFWHWPGCFSAAK